MSFWDSKLIKDLETGKLPDVPVTVKTSSIITLSVAFIIISVIVILLAKLLNKL